MTKRIHRLNYMPRHRLEYHNAICKAQMQMAHTHTDALECHISGSKNAAQDVRTLTHLAERVLRQQETAFVYTDKPCTDRRRGQAQTSATAKPLGKALMDCLRIDVQGIRDHFPQHRFHPYLRLAMECLEHTRPMLSAPPPVALPPGASHPRKYLAVLMAAQALLYRMRELAGQPEFTQECRRIAKSARERSQSTHKYVRHLFEQCSRLLVVRVDLSYADAPRGCVAQSESLPKPDYRQACEDRERLIYVLRHQVFKDKMKGYVMRLENALMTGYHFHLALFLDGSLLRDGVNAATVVGLRWKEITDQQGRHYNCNLALLQGHYKEPGIGMIHRGDERLRAGLSRALTYMCKADSFVAYDAGEGARTFFRGECTKHGARKSEQRDAQSAAAIVATPETSGR